MRCGAISLHEGRQDETSPFCWSAQWWLIQCKGMLWTTLNECDIYNLAVRTSVTASSLEKVREMIRGGVWAYGE